ncbi:MAG: aldehyde ferredoxin oxidoreductase C-terminal domain-containing protein [Promethearchaeota archaeon]
MPKLFRINLKSQEITSEEITPTHPYVFFAGRSLSSKIIADEVPPKTDPLGSGNKLIFATGFLTGTPCPNSGRISIGAKSPLTGGIKESNVGGRAPALLGRHDIRAIVCEGISESWLLLLIEPTGNIKAISCGDLQSKNNYELSTILRERYGKNCGIFSIGIAGEKCLKLASIASIDMEGYPSRHAGRGGMGTVMGSKKLKAIVVQPPEKTKITYSDVKTFRSVSKEWGRALYSAKRSFSKFGTLIGLTTMNSLNALPTQNYRRGSFKDVDQISAESLYDYILKNDGKNGIPCSPGCVIKCSNLLKNAKGEHITSSLEYETVALNGSNLLINNIEKLAEIDHVCDDLGVDTIEMGNAVGVFMETGKITWGDADSVITLIKGIQTDKPDSLIVAQGAYQTGKHFGISRVAQVKKQGLPGYDPRSFKGMGVTFITSPMGADHTAGSAIANRNPYPDRPYGKVYEGEHKVQLSKELQIFTMIHDAVGQCFFVGPTYESVPLLVQLLNARFGWNITSEELIDWSKSWITLERRFNDAEGLPPVDDLPQFMLTEQLEDNPDRKWDISSEELDVYWKNF